MNAAARELVRLARDARRRELVADDNIQDAQKVYGRHGGPKRIGGRVARRMGGPPPATTKETARAAT